MKTKQQIQEEIAALQKQLEEMEQPKTYHYLMLDGAIACAPIKDIFNILPSFDDDGYDQPHGFGKFETREYAEHARAVLIGALDLAKRESFYLPSNAINYSQKIALEKMAWDCLLVRGKKVIKAIEEGTYE